MGQAKTWVAMIAIVFSVFSAGCAHRGAKQPIVRNTAPVSTPPTAAPSPTPTTTEPTPAPAIGSVEEDWTEKGIASWYGEPYHGRRTASGEIYDMHQLTAAHKTLAFGSVVKVKRRDTGADVKVRINDRGPFIEGRIIDLSFAAAKKIDLDVDGVAPVKIKVVGHETTPQRKPARVEEPEDCFWVQVGAFGDPDNARGAEAELERNGVEAVVLEGLDEFWRVRVGPFDEEKLAERARNRITDAWPTAHVIPCGG
ncbi:MAG: septal ring lytic transglycosylase RlpA family protein [Acidobacteria bacterium]|uniref:Probable endolytic peptidoglycan transglycosylase RlpA n=1 Tax=Candidatus Sulfomarinibacter kjeldsenii TaxID=2885994 RepID=A0A8J6Y078_9BACT|nr:septal ring lytic transglycosylase RlpA family protein [Candidatus Sulfomarinibacter kjeldsenii]